MANTSKQFKPANGLFNFLLLAGVALSLGVLMQVPSADAATYTVLNTNDLGAGSLRQAIIDANGNAGADVINFDALLSGAINLDSDLEVITETVTIDGSTAADGMGGPDIVLIGTGESYCLSITNGAGHVVKGLACTGASNGFLLGASMSGGTIGGTGARDANHFNNMTQAGIKVDGADNVNIIGNQFGAAGANVVGISSVNNVTGLVIGGSTAADRNIIVNSTENGIELTSTAATIKGNYIGTGSGDDDAGNGQNGIMINLGVTNTFIGGTNAGDRNIISGNTQNGIRIAGSNGIVIENNFIGTNAAGAVAIPNSQSGILLESQLNVVGGTTSASRNLISGNTLDGIRIDGNVNNASSNIIKNNYIGTNFAGTAAVANGAAGIQVIAGGTATGLIIGDTDQGNVISGNTGTGIYIASTLATGAQIYNNTIGLAADKTAALGNGGRGIRTVADSGIIGEANVAGRRNFIASNVSFGIHINGADSSTIVNNYIGVATDGTTQRTNSDQAILVDATGASNTIGGTATGAQNVIAAANLKNCVRVNTDAGNFNTIRQNNCLNGGNILLTAPANESIATPTVTTANTSYASGTSVANGTVDLFSNGTFFATVTADGAGAWEKHASFTLSQKLSASVTNGTNSTSSTSDGTDIAQDSTSPTTPIVTSHANGSYVTTATINLSGTKEANTSIWIDGVQQVANDALTTWTIAGFALVEGQNNLSVVAKDYTPNSSTTLALTIHRDTSIPAAPNLSYPSTSTQTVTITGSGTESGASVYIGTDTEVDVDGLGNFSVNVSIQPGVNSISITIVDAAGNTSPASVATVTNTAGGGSSGGSSGGSNSSSNTVGDDDDDDQNAMAGEQEEDPVVDEPVADTDEPTNDNTDNTDTVSEPTGSTSTPEDTPTNTTSGTTTVKTDEPVKSFYSGIYEYVEPIKIQTVRDTFPEKPLLPSKFNEKVLESKLFGDKNELGVPQILIDLKGKGRELTATRDSDGDGAYDWEEILNGSNIDVDDTDGDGRSDGEELFIYGSNPADPDSDGDGISDLNDSTVTVYTAPEVSAQEIVDYIEEVTLTEPVGQADSDEDGLSDLDEIYKGTDPQVADTDGDGLDDGFEVLILDTDPTTTTPESAVDQISVVNVSGGGGTFESGPQLYTGHAEADVTLSAYEVDEEGEMVLIGQTTTDENGSYILMTSTELSAGKHTIILTTGESLNSLTDISLPIEINVIESVKKPQFEGLGIQNGRSISETRPTLSLKAASDYKIVVLWKSTVNGQTLIADASDQTLNARPVENLELGEHTVTWYAEDLKTGDKSAPTQIAFNVTNTAFVTGETGTSPWTIALGSIAVLASLTALALFYRNRKIEA